MNLQVIAQHMSSALDFFQPDAVGVYQTEEVFICNKFLFNTPESVCTSQICQNQRYVLAATCRLDNREEIAAKIQLENPSEKSDHDYLLAAYTFYQEKCVEHLLGDFSFVVWDKEKKTLFMAKDHIGIKPLYYYLDENILVFSTYIQGIKAVKGIDLALDKLYIARELKNFPPTYEDTFFENIKRLKPSHFLKFNPQNRIILEQKYWDLTPIDISAFKTEEEIYDELRRLFTEAVVCRTRTNKNIGCQLSGGLDSSAIAVLLSRNIDKNRLHTFSFVLSDKTRLYSEKGIDEQETQNIIIEYADFKRENHHKIKEFHYKDVFEELEVSNLIMGGYATTDAIWQDTMFKKAGENNIGYIMSGFPGDECVSNNGNLYYYDYLGYKNWREIFILVKKGKLSSIKKIISYLISQQIGTRTWRYKINQAQRNLLKSESKYNKILKKDKGFHKFYPTFKEYLKNQVCRSHTCHRVESEGLYSLQHRVETVYPLADIRLIRFTYSLPTFIFIPSAYDRRLFRNMCYGILPDKIRFQMKRNGATTLAFVEYWMKTKLLMMEERNISNNFNMIAFEKKLNLEGLDLLKISLRKYLVDFFIEINC